VNVAEPGGNISTKEYDEQNNVIRSLTAANRARALAASDKLTRAREIDTQSFYANEGLEPVEELGPRHAMVVGGQTVQGRRHTVTEYDPDDLHLPIRISVGARVDDQSADSDVRVTTHSYDAVGKALRKPTATTTDPTGLNLTTRYTYDAATGREISKTLPKGNPSTPDAATTKTTLYSAGAAGGCADRPEWAGLPCRVEPAAQPGGALPKIPTKTITYDRWLQPATVSESVEGTTHTRTTTTTYDAAGRLQTESVTATSGTELPTVTHAYSATTGREITVSTANPAKTITRGYDSLGRLTSYRDAEGVTSTITSYDVRDRVVTSSDAKGTQTRTYDALRGLVTGLSDSQAGSFTAAYDADGDMTSKKLPNGLTVTSTLDETGNETRRQYTKSGNCGSSCVWLDSQAPVNVHDQWSSQTTTTQTGQLSQSVYAYDASGRLQTVNDTPRSGGCTVRAYTYDANGNRTKLTSKPPGTDGACQPSAPGSDTTHSYDEADRVTATGYDYDAFGRILTVPGADAGGGALTSTYYVNDLARTLSQDGLIQTYTLDPAQRMTSRVTTGTTTGTETYHYRDDTDAPSWIANNTDGTNYTRQIEGIDGELTAVRDNSGIRFQLTNLHGDVVAEAPSSTSATTLLRTSDNDEFGVPRTQTSARNQWLGGSQRSTELKSGVIAMGVRTYVPQLGRFLQPDPVPGGSCNDYDYACQDPVNNEDVSGASTLSRRISYAYHYFIRRGLTRAQASGLVGNLQHESGLDPTKPQIGGGPGRGHRPVGHRQRPMERPPSIRTQEGTFVDRFQDTSPVRLA
jgi:RHS repeat-associated protein